MFQEGTIIPFPADYVRSFLRPSCHFFSFGFATIICCIPVYYMLIWSEALLPRPPSKPTSWHLSNQSTHWLSTCKTGQQLPRGSKIKGPCPDDVNNSAVVYATCPHKYTHGISCFGTSLRRQPLLRDMALELFQCHIGVASHVKNSSIVTII